MAKRVNWDFIKPLYRAGKLSNREICRQYADAHTSQDEFRPTVDEKSIREKAKKDPNGWSKNLADKVKDKIKENLVRTQVRTADPGLSDDEIIDHVAGIGSGVIQRHRNEIKALIQHENRLLTELTENPGKVHISSYQGEVIKTELEMTVLEKAATLKALTQVRAQRIALERQAYNLNDDEAKDNGHEDWLEMIA